MTFSKSEHTFKRFDIEIQQLIDLVMAMGREVEQQVRRAVAAFREGDADAAQAVIAGDAEVNRLDMEIDRGCVRLLSRRQPMSTDLRLVMALNKAVNDLNGSATRPRPSPRKRWPFTPAASIQRRAFPRRWTGWPPSPASGCRARSTVCPAGCRPGLAAGAHRPVEDAFQDILRELAPTRSMANGRWRRSLTWRWRSRPCKGSPTAPRIWPIRDLRGRGPDVRHKTSDGE